MQSVQSKQTRRGFIMCCLMFATLYISHGCYYPYIQLYYKDIGLTVRQIGLIAAIGPCLAVLAQTPWGRFADVKGRKFALSLTLILSGLCLLLFYINKSFAFTLGVASLYVLCATASAPLTDTIGLDYAAATGTRFAPMRLMGTIGFGIMPLIVGGIMEKNITNIFPLYCVFCMIAAVVCQLVPNTQKKEQPPEGKAEEKKKAGFSVILDMVKDPVIQFVLVMNFAVSFTMSATNFITVYASDMGVGTMKAGWLNTVSAGFEIPMFLTIDWILKKKKCEHIMLTTLIFSSIRMAFAFFGGVFTEHGFLFLCFSQMMHSVSYIMLYYCSAQMIHKHVADDVKATAQTLISTISMGLSRVIGSLVAGQIGQTYGLQRMYLVFAVVVLLFLPPCFLLYRRMHRLEVKETA